MNEDKNNILVHRQTAAAALKCLWFRSPDWLVHRGESKMTMEEERETMFKKEVQCASHKTTFSSRYKEEKGY